MRLLLKSGADVNAMDMDMIMPLHLCSCGCKWQPLALRGGCGCLLQGRLHPATLRQQAPAPGCGAYAASCWCPCKRNDQQPQHAAAPGL
jgi:hypothetical protein